MIEQSLHVHLSPLIPESILIAFAVLAAFLLIVSLWQARHLSLWRTVCAAVFLIVLANPSLIEEKREAVNDIAAIVVDRSPSQMMGKRGRTTDDMLSHLVESLQDFQNLDVRIINAPQNTSALAERTDIFDLLEKRMADIPESRRAGVFVVTDGQIHDAPKNPDDIVDRYGPIHTLLSGQKNERDRQIKIMNAPAYGLIGEDAEITYRVVDTDNISSRSVNVVLRYGDNQTRNQVAVPGRNYTMRVPITNAGQNIFELSVDEVRDELTLANNKAALVVNGVRDRLKVLLVSGQPHNGGRTWRDMLSSDPGVDLVHFTILREPNKLDRTPQNELSLIAFPFRELFEIKLYDFDLIIFDRYRLNRILPTYYFSNIARYVREGGALLEASGPSFSNEFSIYSTDLRSVLPGAPTGEVANTSFQPVLTTVGLNHPVTMDFQNIAKSWGPWLRQVFITPNENSDIVMNGVNNRPLMVLSRVGEGRVAQIASDQIWLWSRGYEGGGPHRELLRRTAHWLMKEPELDENALNATLRDDVISIRRRSLTDNEKDLTIVAPDGSEETITLSRDGDIGWLRADVNADQIGIYRIFDNQSTHFVVTGSLTSPEMTGVTTTAGIMQPISDVSGGDVTWIQDMPNPDIRMLPANRKYTGRNWLGLKQNNDFTVTGVRDIPLLPAWLALLLVLSASVMMWWREGKTF